MRALRLPVDLLSAFPAWRVGSRAGFKPPSSRLTVIPDGAAEPLRALRVHASPAASSSPLLLTLLRELHGRLDQSVRLIVLVDPAADRAALQRAMRRTFGRSRIRLVTADFNTIFARDAALAARDRRRRRVLLVPRKARRTAAAIDADPLEQRAVEGHLRVRVRSSLLHWEGGNILVDTEGVLVGADTIVENMTTLGLTADEVISILSADFGRRVVVLGDPADGQLDTDVHRMVRSAQASYHLDLDVALVGRQSQQPVALVADPRAGLNLLDGLLSRGALPRPPHLSAQQARTEMAHEYRAAAGVRNRILRSYRDTLRYCGYRIVNVPELRTRNLSENPTGLHNFVYCNVLPGVNGGRPAIHYLPWNVPLLDEAAEQSYRDAGAHPVRMARTGYLATTMMERAAGLRCYCGAMP